MPLRNENEAYADLLCRHLEEMVWRLHRLPPDQWDYQFAPPAATRPSPTRRTSLGRSVTCLRI